MANGNSGSTSSNTSSNTSTNTSSNSGKGGTDSSGMSLSFTGGLNSFNVGKGGGFNDPGTNAGAAAVGGDIGSTALGTGPGTVTNVVNNQLSQNPVSMAINKAMEPAIQKAKEKLALLDEKTNGGVSEAISHIYNAIIQADPFGLISTERVGIIDNNNGQPFGESLVSGGEATPSGKAAPNTESATTNTNTADSISNLGNDWSGGFNPNGKNYSDYEANQGPAVDATPANNNVNQQAQSSSGYINRGSTISTNGTGGSISSGLTGPERDTESIGLGVFDPDKANYDQDNWNRGMEVQSSSVVSDEQCKQFAMRAFHEDSPAFKVVKETIIKKLD